MVFGPAGNRRVGGLGGPGGPKNQSSPPFVMIVEVAGAAQTPNIDDFRSDSPPRKKLKTRLTALEATGLCRRVGLEAEAARLDHQFICSAVACVTLGACCGD